MVPHRVAFVRDEVHAMAHPTHHEVPAFCEVMEHCCDGLGPALAFFRYASWDGRCDANLCIGGQHHVRTRFGKGARANATAGRWGAEVAKADKHQPELRRRKCKRRAQLRTLLRVLRHGADGQADQRLSAAASQSKVFISVEGETHDIGSSSARKGSCAGAADESAPASTAEPAPTPTATSLHASEQLASAPSPTRFTNSDRRCGRPG
eukprot:CAMPEP_0117569874 /NCGR_PEP_ID=MMETSP0784-20121206/58894_1 /TAXON_ID=39447 /ORGANISM="" /LENGTH=207 /DNA_ID=CAMNT_0005367883 /DNA_START=154 /DNA_END=775 /DNA_ORIENTATION=-